MPSIYLNSICLFVIDFLFHDTPEQTAEGDTSISVIVAWPTTGESHHRPRRRYSQDFGRATMNEIEVSVPMYPCPELQ